MQTIFLVIGRDRITVFEKNGRGYVKQYINGNPHVEYHRNQLSDKVAGLVEYLVNEFNLSTRAELEFDVLENEDPDSTREVVQALDGLPANIIMLKTVISEILEKLSRDKKLKTDILGINYDGVSYKRNGQEIMKSTFDLLSCTITAEKLVNLMD